MGLKKTENRVKVLLVDTITALCRNTLQFNAELNVEGLIGITVDNQEIFLVNINQQLKGKDYDKEKEKEKESEKDTPRKHKKNSHESPEGKGGKRRRGDNNDFVDLCDDDETSAKKRKDDDVVFVRKERDGRGYSSSSSGSGNPTTPSRRLGGADSQSDEEAITDDDDGDWVPGTTGSKPVIADRPPAVKRSKDPNKKFRCEICGKIFAFMSQFQAHMDKHQMEDCGALPPPSGNSETPPTTSAPSGSSTPPASETAPAPSAAKPVPDSPNKYVCQVCAESFKIACFFKKHMEHSHAGVGYPDPHQGQHCSTCDPPPPPTLTKQ